MSYRPQPGTFPARVIDYLRTLPAGAERSSAEIGDELGQYATDVPQLLQYARNQGGLKSRKEGRLCFWSLGDGTPETLPEDHEPDQPLPRKRQSKPKPDALAVLPIVPQLPAIGFRAGLWTDGTLEIWRDGDLFLLTSEEVGQVRDLLRGAP